MPSWVYHALRTSRQYWYHFIDSEGWQKNSISICSNSRLRKVKLRGLISLRKALPTWAIPNGNFTRLLESTFLKLAKIPCAVSGRKYATDEASCSAPMKVWNIRLNCRGSVSSPSQPSAGHGRFSGTVSTAERVQNVPAW